MRSQFYFRDLLSLHVELAQATTPVSDIDPLARGIEPQVIGVISILNALEELERCSVKNLYGAILGTGYVHAPVRREVKNALRFCKTRDCICPLTSLEVDH